MRTYAPALALCALLAAPTLVASAADPPPVVYKACEKKPTADDTEAAKGLFSAGKVSYNEADYPKAIQLWRDAFERDCTALLLLQNLANAYEKAGNIPAAITTLETYLARDPQSSEAATIQKRIENMKKARAAATTAPPVASSAPAAATSSPTTPPPPTTNPQPQGRRPLTPLFVAGGGAILGITGLVLYLGASSENKDASAKYKSTCPGGEKQCPDLFDKAESSSTRMSITSTIGYVGLAGVAGGLAWYLLSKPEGQTARVLAPSVAPGYAGVSLAGSF
ncbi:MAG: tetratricopeptide repeat protein [Polyangiaceae bacterium]|nr:tetratricopeptide repeat protein [Polyangiaceae bacterium]